MERDGCTGDGARTVEWEGGKLADAFARDGYCVIPALFAEADCAAQAAALKAHVAHGVHSGHAAGSRTLLGAPWCAALAEHLAAHPAVRACIGEDVVALQCTAFEKSPARNWLVALHQDLSVPFRQPITHPELGPWTVKEGMHFAQAQAGLLEQLAAVRVHLDVCGVDDGALRVVAGSHRAGVLAPEDARALRDAHGETVVPVPAGGVMVMRPLLLHASSKSSGTSLRRVLHFVFAPREAPFV